MSDRHRGFHLARIFGKKDEQHKVKRINNPGEAVRNVFFIVCGVLITIGLAVAMVRAVACQPEFRPLHAEEMPR